MSRLIALGVLGLVLAGSPAEARGVRQRVVVQRQVVARPQVVVVQRVQVAPRRPSLIRRVISLPGRILRSIF